ncbi:zinc ribbon domain-containing protein [soil metagenome]
MSELEKLLALQELDTATDQLHHRRNALPERAELAARRDALAALETTMAAAAGRRDELGRAQARLEDDVAAVEKRKAEVDRMLYSGRVSAPRDLQALQHEMGALERRQTSLEDAVLELMEQSDPVAAELDVFEQTRGALQADATRLADAVVEAESAIDAEVAELGRRRVQAAAEIPENLLTEYERLRSRLGGTGIARLVGANCGGCHLTLPAMEIDRIRHARGTGVVHCSGGDWILVS